MDAQKSPELIAIIGMGCRMPGDIRSPSDLWEALMSEKIANTSRVPSSRFNIDAYLHPNNDRPGSLNVPGGYFLDEDPAAFDPGLFNISPVEAMWMDPQQRKLLEVTYEALEGSGTTLESISGTRTGCFVGSFTTDYQQMIGKEPDFRHAYVATGIDTGILGSRLSHVFNLTGPSLMLNTACSSSMTALDIACKSISMGQCDGAIVGGTNLMLTIDQQMNTAGIGVLSPTNQTHTFDESADGYGRAEGVGALYLKPLSAALKNGDPIRAVIRSTANGSNGRSLEALTHPSIKGQADVIVAAHRDAGLGLHETDYIECHGTGTQIGDPIEVKAIHQAVGSAAARTSPILIGSVKPNIGHSEAASSMGTIIKAIMALDNGIIPPTAGMVILVPWHDLNVKVVTQPTPLPASAHPHRIGVSAFGYGGTNAHVILEESVFDSPGRRRHRSFRALQGVPKTFHTDADHDEAGRPHLLLFSAHDEATLRNNLQDVSDVVKEANLVDLAYTLGLRRTKLQKRAFVVAHKDRAQSEIKEATTRISAPKSAPVFGLVFTGQGAQWPGMGARLLAVFPSLSQKIQQLDRHLKSLAAPPDWELEAVLRCPTDAELYDQAEYAQPLCTAVQIILVDLLIRWALKPVAHVGHSSGEIGAAYAAGLISAEDAITVAYYRGKAAALIKEDGAMMAVNVSVVEAKLYLPEQSMVDKVVVACHNSPHSCTLSGDREAIERLKAHLDTKGVFARVLKTGGKAYHSHHMEEAAVIYNEFMKAEESHAGSWGAPVTRMFSTSQLGQVQDHVESITHAYWVKNLRNPVLFDEAMKLMLQEIPEINTLIEVGPHSALSGPLKQICRTASREDVAYFPTLERKQDDVDQLLGLAGNLWASDAALNLHSITSMERAMGQGVIEEVSGALLVDLPTYHWTYTKSYWSEPRVSKEQRENKEPRHDILGRRVPGVSPLEPVWRNILRQRDLPWLGQHRIGGEVMLPAAGYLALAIEAITQITDAQASAIPIQSYTLRDVTILSATVVPDDDVGTETMFHLQRIEVGSQASMGSAVGQWYQFTTSCCSYGAWKETARGKICINVRGHGKDHKPYDLPPTPVRQEPNAWLEKLRNVGFDLGPTFCNSQALYSDEKAYIARADMTIGKDCGLMMSESRYVLHPGVLDSCLQPTQVAIHRGHLDSLDCGTIPTSFKEVTVFPPTPEQMEGGCVLETWTPGVGNRSYASDIQLLRDDGALLVQIAGYQHVRYPSAIPKEPQGHLQRDLYLRTDWKIDVDYLGWAAQNEATLGKKPVAKLVDQFLHKDVTTRTLCLDSSLAVQVLALRSDLPLTVAAPFQNTTNPVTRASYEGTTLDSVDLGHEYSKAQDYKDAFDLIVGYSMTNIEPTVLESLRVMTSLKGRVVLSIDSSAKHDELQAALISTRFSGIDTILPSGHVITTATEPTALTSGITNGAEQRMLLLYRDNPTPLLSQLSERLVSGGWDTRSQSIGAPLSLRPNEQVILLPDAEGPFLVSLSQCELQSLIEISETAKSVIWVTCGGLLIGDKPEYGMAEGAARTIRKEKGTLDLVTVDFDAEGTTEARVIDLVSDIAHRQQIHGWNGETEYYVKGGVVHVSRLVSCRELHQQFVPDSGETAVLKQSEHPSVSARRSAQGSLEFYRDDKEGGDVAEPLKPGEVEIHVEAIGLNAMDLPDDMDFLNHQVAGTVTRVGDSVRPGIEPGCRVIGFASGKLGTFQRTSQDLVQATELSGAALAQATTLPSAFTTAMFGLDELAHIQPGDNVVIVDSMGDVGLAALEICRIHGANAIVVTSSQTAQDSLLSTGVVPQRNIIEGRRTNVSARIDEATAGQGADVVFCAAPQEDTTVFHDCAQSLAEFARVVVLSGIRGSAKSNLPSIPRQSVSLLQFRLTDLLERKPQSVSRILKQCVALYQAGSISLLGAATTHGPTELDQSLLHAARTDMGSGRNILVYDDSASFCLKPGSRPLSFNPDATYLLVGCLGGIGRQVALWMAERGAKHIAFVSRTGTTKPVARETVEALQGRGVDVSVLRANVTVLAELKDAVAQIDPAFPVRGVLSAASVLMDSVFSNMTFDQWVPVTESKVKGAANLHELFKNEGELDFFVMTSSVTSILGSAGQCNYGAGNSFLDSLARHRRLRGLPAVSLILPAIFGVGYIQEHSLEQAILSKGMYGIYEKEMLEAFEVSMTPQDLLPPDLDHFVVGLQPRRFGNQIRTSGAHIPLREDPRLNWLKSAIEEQTESEDHPGGGNTGVAAHESITRTVQQAPDEERAIDAVAVFMARRLARVLMLEEDQVQMTQSSIASHGLDSMIGTEFRNWIFREFKVDVPFQQLLAGSLTEAAALVEKTFDGGVVDVLVNNAGYLEPWAKIAESDTAQWLHTIDININGLYRTSRSFLPLVLRSATRTVLNISSIGAHMVTPGASAYQTTKFAVCRLSEFMANDHREEGLVAIAVRTELGLGMPEYMHEVLVDTPKLAADTLVWLRSARRE
ncbi:polyketide synthase [Apiospora phragmitis]|uniref:Polyketide synthase n=1 Tax=Apiospora phragmitis TaxID=2905665 RepID=A0ABR1US70_9PEZI